MRYLAISLLISFFSFCTPLSAISVSVQKNKDQIFINETVHVNYTISYPSIWNPDLFAFFYALQEQRSPLFHLVSTDVSSTSEEKMTKLQLALTLSPTRTGKAIFAPGFLYFGTEGSILLPATEIDCLSTGFSSLMLAPLLPLHPEAKIELSIENRLRLQNSEVILQEKNKSVTLFVRYKEAWRILNGLLLSIGGACLLLWIFVEYELLHKIAPPAPPEKLLISDLLAELQNPSLSLGKRWAILSLLIRKVLSKREKKDLLPMTCPELLQEIDGSASFRFEEKITLVSILNRLDLICFANSPSSEEEWKTVFGNCRILFSSEISATK